jgi:hypothetical protein
VSRVVVVVIGKELDTDGTIVQPVLKQVMGAVI